MAEKKAPRDTVQGAERPAFNWWRKGLGEHFSVAVQNIILS
jgi:hypothetical protein